MRCAHLLLGMACVGVGAEILSDWMGELTVLQNQTLLDLSLPGCHDAMTFDLSERVSDNANDLPAPIAWALHEFGPVVGVVGVGGFIKDQAVTQQLSMKDQLEAGMRFVDFRVVYSGTPASMRNA
jgi:hypothetical protein